MITCPLCNEIYKTPKHNPDVFLHRCMVVLNTKTKTIEGCLDLSEEEPYFFTISAKTDNVKKIVLRFDGHDFTISNYSIISHKHNTIVLSRKIIPFSSFLHDKNQIAYLYNMFLKAFKISYML